MSQPGCNADNAQPDALLKCLASIVLPLPQTVDQIPEVQGLTDLANKKVAAVCQWAGSQPFICHQAWVLACALHTMQNALTAVSSSLSACSGL